MTHTNQGKVTELVWLTYNTCLIALSKAIIAAYVVGHYKRQAEYMAFLAGLMERATREVRKCAVEQKDAGQEY